METFFKGDRRRVRISGERTSYAGLVEVQNGKVEEILDGFSYVAQPVDVTVAIGMDEILEFSELTEYADLPMKRAPKGAPALMSMAVHLLKDSELLLIDEVFGGGGNKSKVKCEQYLKEYLDTHENVTAIIVTNAITYLKSVCESAILLDHGKIIFDGPAEEAGNILKTINK